MTPSKRPSENLVGLAATMRATGESWKEIADKVGRSEGRVRAWPHAYPDEWDRHFSFAERQLFADAATECRTILRQLLRSKEEKIQLAAADKLLKVRMGERAAVKVRASAGKSDEDRWTADFVNSVKNLSDEELETMLKEEIGGLAGSSTTATPELPAATGPGSDAA